MWVDMLAIRPAKALMRRREKPLRIQGFVALHNLAMFLLSLWMTVETLRQA